MKKMLFHSSRTQLGFSMVELLVALVVGMLVLLAATSGASFYEANRRNTMGGNSALENATAAAYAIQTDARMAGYGSDMVLSDGTKCAAIAAPVTITSGANATASDQIAITYYKSLAPAAATPSCGASSTTTYSISSNKLLAGTDELAENIVQMKAQYGISTTGTTVINKWVNPASLGTNKALAIRYVIVARNPQKEKLADGSICTNTSSSGTPTSAAPVSGFNTETGTDETVTLDLSATADWKCYSYRTVTLTVPMRNILIQSNNAAATGA